MTPATVRPLRAPVDDTPPRPTKVALLQLQVEASGKWILIHCRFGKVEGTTIRLSRYWAKTLYLQLGKALGR